MVPFRQPRRTPEEVVAALNDLYQAMSTRRSVRSFAPDPVPQEAIEQAIRIAGTAPSGAHRQPWHFVAISSSDLKAKLRAAVEATEREFYTARASIAWLAAISQLGTDANKPYLEIAPWLIVVFRRDYDLDKDGLPSRNYYMTESCGIAVGFLLAALHLAGLATLTHTPAPMTFLRDLLGRPENEKPFLLIPVGYPAEDCMVPNLRRKSLEEIAEFR